MNNIIVSPSILAADYLNFGKAVDEINACGAEFLHMDIMDGLFVPNLTFGVPLLKSIRKKTDNFIDAHLMIVQPGRYIKEFAEAGANGITFHYEAEIHCQKLLSQIRNYGLKAGIAIVPSTPVSILEELLPSIDIALIMTVNPGFGGQELLPNCLEKVKKLAKMRENAGFDFKISVDGGINEKTAVSAQKAGADILVMGSTFFNSGDKQNLINKLQNQSYN